MKTSLTRDIKTIIYKVELGHCTTDEVITEIEKLIDNALYNKGQEVTESVMASVEASDWMNQIR